VPFSVVLDTCVVYPAHLRDTLLRLAERGLYQARWSSGIVDALRKNLVEIGIDPHMVERLINEMNRAFPEGLTTGERGRIRHRGDPT